MYEHHDWLAAPLQLDRKVTHLGSRIYEADFPINGQNVDLWCALLRGREATAFSSVYREGSRW
jgi:hypothetical protein